MGGQNNLHCPHCFPLRALRPGGGTGAVTEISRCPSPQNCDGAASRVASLHAPARLGPDQTSKRRTGSGVSPPVQIATPCAVYPPLSPMKTASAKRGPPCALHPRPSLTSGTFPQNVGLLLWPPQRATPSAGASVVLLDVPLPLFCRSSPCRAGVSAACRSPPVVAGATHDGLSPRMSPHSSVPPG